MSRGPHFNLASPYIHRTHEEVAVQVDVKQLFSIRGPHRIRRAPRRNFPLSFSIRKTGDVELLLSRFIGHVGDPTAIRRNPVAGDAEFGGGRLYDRYGLEITAHRHSPDRDVLLSVAPG